MNVNERYPELDALRGIAVLLMMLYHLLFDLSSFYGWPVLRSLGEGGDILRMATASMFFLLVGICFVISWERRCLDTRSRVTPSTPSPDLIEGRGVYRGVGCATRHDTFFLLYRKYLCRGLLIFAGGMCITLVTYVFSPTLYVKFGVLHFIGVSTFLLPFFVSVKKWNALLGFLIILFGTQIGRTSGAPLRHFLFPLGFPAPGFSSLDYYPLLPWFGVILCGMAVGYVLYIPKRHHSLTRIGIIPFPGTLLLFGKYSLWIYFVHQPLLLIFLTMILG